MIDEAATPPTGPSDETIKKVKALCVLSFASPGWWPSEPKQLHVSKLHPRWSLFRLACILAER